MNYCNSFQKAAAQLASRVVFVGTVVHHREENVMILDLSGDNLQEIIRNTLCSIIDFWLYASTELLWNDSSEAELCSRNCMRWKMLQLLSWDQVMKVIEYLSKKLQNEKKNIQCKDLALPACLYHLYQHSWSTYSHLELANGVKSISFRLLVVELSIFQTKKVENFIENLFKFIFTTIM